MRKSRNGTAGEPACPTPRPKSKYVKKGRRQLPPRTRVVLCHVDGPGFGFAKSFTLYAPWREVLHALRLMAEECGFDRRPAGVKPAAADQADESDWLDDLDQADAVTIPLQHLPAANKEVQHG